MSEKYKVGDSEIPHFITTTIIDWVDLFTRSIYKDLVLESLQHCITQKGLIVYAYCIMPSHLHLITATNGKLKLPEIIRDFKKYTSKQLIAHINHVSESRRFWLLKKFAYAANRGKRGSKYKVWQDGFHPEELINNEMMQQKLDYIHQNPVKDGFVFKAEDWVYSSASFYSGELGLEKLALQMLE